MSSDLVRHVVEEGSLPSIGRREYVLQFGPVIVEPHSLATISVKPTVKFRGQHLIVPNDTGSQFIIAELAVEETLLLEDVSAILFEEENSLKMLLPDVICPIYKRIYLSVRNNTDSPREFVGDIIGQIVP